MSYSTAQEFDELVDTRGYEAACRLVGAAADLLEALSEARGALALMKFRPELVSLQGLDILTKRINAALTKAEGKQS